MKYKYSNFFVHYVSPERKIFIKISNKVVIFEYKKRIIRIEIKKNEKYIYSNNLNIICDRVRNHIHKHLVDQVHNRFQQSLF